MKFPAIISAFVLPLALHAGPITQKPLDEFLIYDIPVAFKSGTTTIMFPSESWALCKSVAVQVQPNADFVISFTPGNFCFTRGEPFLRVMPLLTGENGETRRRVRDRRRLMDCQSGAYH